MQTKRPPSDDMLPIYLTGSISERVVLIIYLQSAAKQRAASKENVYGNSL